MRTVLFACIAALFPSLILKVTPHSAVQKKVIIESAFDTLITPFADRSYQLKIHFIDRNNYDEDKKNTVITFTHFEKGKENLIFQTRCHCMSPWFYFKDFDNDGVKDILIFFNDGARANPQFHLYLVKPTLKKLICVKGFEELPSPDFDQENKVITSTALFGTHDALGFYKIGKDHRLVNLGHGFTEKMGSDNNKYDNAIKAIFKNHHKTR